MLIGYPMFGSAILPCIAALVVVIDTATTWLMNQSYQAKHTVVNLK